MFAKNIIESVKKQGIYENPHIEDIAVTITLINGDILPFCFITSEDEKYISIVCTDLATGGEKVNIISKDSVVRIAVCYADDIAINDEKKEETKDKMII